MSSYTVYQQNVGWPLYLLRRLWNVHQFVMLDDVEVSKAGLNRMLLVGPNGNFYHTFEIAKPDGMYTTLDKAFFPRWEANVEQLLKTLQSAYGRCEGWQQEKEEFKQKLAVISLEASRNETAPTFDMVSRHLLSFLFVHEPVTEWQYVHKASELCARGSDPTERLVNLGRKLGCNTYVCGGASAGEYVNHQMFRDSHINVEVQMWTMPGYAGGKQQQLDSRVSAFDLLFRHGRPALIEMMENHAEDKPKLRRVHPTIA